MLLTLQTTRTGLPLTAMGLAHTPSLTMRSWYVHLFALVFFAALYKGIEIMNVIQMPPAIRGCLVPQDSGDP